MKKITVYSTLGKNATEFNSNGATWKDVQREMSDLRISYSGMKAVIGETRLTLESEKAIVPETDFTLYLMPIKTKSGADRKELFAQMKAAVDSKQAEKSQFMVEGKNMTQLSTSTLEELWAKFQGTGTSKAPAKASDVKPEPKKETPKPKTETGVAAKAQVLTLSQNAGVILDEIGELLEEEDVDSSVATVVLDKVRLIIDLFSDVKSEAKATKSGDSAMESESQKADRLKREAKDALNKRLQAGADDLMRDFSDVKR